MSGSGIVGKAARDKEVRAGVAERGAGDQVGQVAAAGRQIVDRRQDFPILARRINGRPLVYLDNAATTQKPRPVLDAMRHAYEMANANVHRGVHTLSQEATEAFEGARATIARFVNARSAAEIVFVRGATEAINLVAATLGRRQLQAGDEIVLTQLEHHSNIVPWQMLREERGVVLKVAPIDDTGDLLLDRFADLLTDRTRLVCVTHVSNVLGTITPIAEIVRMAHSRGVRVLVDGCQAVAHQAVDVQAIDADFYVFSAHKMFGPTGIGALFGKREILDRLPPYQGGGEMIASVSFERSTYKPAPHRFEAGTPAIVEAIGFAAAAGTSRRSARRGSKRTNRRCSATCWATRFRLRGRKSLAHRGDEPGSSRSRSGAFIPTTLPPFSMAPAWRCAPAIIARSH